MKEFNFKIDPKLVIQGAKNLDDNTRYIFGIYPSNLKDKVNTDFGGAFGVTLKRKHRNNNSLYYYPVQNPFPIMRARHRAKYNSFGGF